MKVQKAFRSVFIFICVILFASCTTEIDTDFLRTEEIIVKVSKDEWIADAKSELAEIYKKANNGKEMPVSLYEIVQKPYKIFLKVRDVRDHVDLVLENRRVVFNGVTGSGKTTECRFIGKVIAGDPERFREFKFDPRKRYEDLVYDGNAKKIGSFVEWLKKAEKDPKNNYVFFVDEINTADPYVLFGTDVINLLENPTDQISIEGVGTLTFPQNFYLMSAMKRVGKDVQQFDDAIFRRIGKELKFPPDPEVLARNLIEAKKYEETHIKRLVYTFIKSNELISKKVGPDYKIGEWGSIKSFFRPDDFPKFKESFITHLDAYPESKNKLSISELDEISNIFENKGEIKHNLIFEAIGGFFGILKGNMEIVSAIVTIILAIAGRIFLTRKRRTAKTISSEIENVLKTLSSDPAKCEVGLNDLLKKIEELDQANKLDERDITKLTNRINQQLLKLTMETRAKAGSKELEAIVSSSIEDNKITTEEISQIEKQLQQEANLSVEDKQHLMNLLAKIHKESKSS